ncbi:MAG: hypothetical protein NTZ74_09085 [Chloroflexi bacterium]|nr:hypothetical protein [Chloroflexota bacterium]
MAFYERIGRTNRDIYDTWFFFENNWPVNQELVEKRTNRSFKEFLITCCGLLEKMDNKGILSGMGEVLSEKQKVWVKNRLREELLFQFKLFLDTHQ